MARSNRGLDRLARTANEVRRYRMLKRLIPAILAVIVVLVTLVYVVSLMYTRFSSFTVSVNKWDAVQYGLALSETKDFAKQTGRLDCHAAEVITNIDGKSLDRLDLGAIDGSDNGANYFCYSFYCMNVGDEILSYDYEIVIANMTLDIERAIRVRLITNYNEADCTKVDYARAAGVDEEGNAIPEPDPYPTTPFYTKNTVMRDSVHDVAPGDVKKFTVIMWLEGNDPDCVDSIIGGEFKIDMKFNVTTHSGIEVVI